MASITLIANVVTDSSGAATLYVSQSGQASYPLPPIAGVWAVDSITYKKNDFASGVDLVITEHESGMIIWTGTNVDASTTFRPRAFIGDPVTGTVSTTVYDTVNIMDGQIKIVISSGGASKTGQFTIRLKQD